jgi:hypothetical protein
MDPIFRAGRGLGRAEMMRLNLKSGTNFLNETIGELSRSKVAGIQAEIDELKRMAGDWARRSTQLPAIIGAIRDQRLGGAGKGYQAFCSGLLLGLAMEACFQANKDTVTEKAKGDIVQWLSMARGHTAALKAQGFVPGMPDYDIPFNAIINPIRVVKRSIELRNFYQLIENLSNQIGNAIR